MDLDQKLFDLLNSRPKVGNMRPVIYGAPGLSDRQVAAIEEQLGFPLPPDFIYLFQNLQDPDGYLVPWAKFDKGRYDQSIAWVLQGIEFDVENNTVWLERWGEKPNSLPAALEIVRQDFKSWPKLLPIFGHRFLAAEPCLSGNPVFSIMQTDIIYYGADLANYLLQEFIDTKNYLQHTYVQPIRMIEVWGELTS